jgi:hypothetical protein
VRTIALQWGPGKGLTIELHPASAQSPAGRRGAMTIDLELSGSIQEASFSADKTPKTTRTTSAWLSRDPTYLYVLECDFELSLRLPRSQDAVILISVKQECSGGDHWSNPEMSHRCHVNSQNQGPFLAWNHQCEKRTDVGN